MKYFPTLISVEIGCVYCSKSFFVKTEHPGLVQATWENHDACPSCKDSGKAKKAKK